MLATILAIYKKNYGVYMPFDVDGKDYGTLYNYVKLSTEGLTKTLGDLNTWMVSQGVTRIKDFINSRGNEDFKLGDIRANIRDKFVGNICLLASVAIYYDEYIEFRETNPKRAEKKKQIAEQYGYQALEWLTDSNNIQAVESVFAMLRQTPGRENLATEEQRKLWRQLDIEIPKLQKVIAVMEECILGRANQQINQTAPNQVYSASSDALKSMEAAQILQKMHNDPSCAQEFLDLQSSDVVAQALTDLSTDNPDLTKRIKSQFGSDEYIEEIYKNGQRSRVTKKPRTQ